MPEAASIKSTSFSEVMVGGGVTSTIPITHTIPASIIYFCKEMTAGNGGRESGDMIDPPL
jgi:hypothetical protein